MGGRAAVYRRRRRRRSPLPITPLAVFGAVIGLGGWGLWTLLGSGGPASADAGEAQGGISGALETSQTQTRLQPTTALPAGTPDLAQSAPIEIEIGSPAAGNGGSGGSGLLASAEPVERNTTPAADPARTSAPATPPITRPEPRQERTVATREPDFTEGSAGAATWILREAEAGIAAGDVLGARALLNSGVMDSRLSEVDRGVVRRRLAALNDEVLFGPTIVAGDPMTESYKVRSGDSLSRIAARQDLDTHWKLIQRVNGLSDPTKIRVGQTLKLVRGPFHAVVRKSSYRLDLYFGPADSPSGWTYVRSFEVGLGELGSTPTGEFMVRENGKLENPAWVNPRDGREQYGRNDPNNPIGEHWIGVEGLGDSAVHTGYGLHGTIEPDSIGTQSSMGCVRLRDDDIALLYELLGEGASRVSIRD
ncbi:MAG: LysM peptidoglycan-binding domain-containing protein [Planctomycetota bacterium]